MFRGPPQSNRDGSDLDIQWSQAASIHGRGGKPLQNGLL